MAALACTFVAPHQDAMLVSPRISGSDGPPCPSREHVLRCETLMRPTPCLLAHAPPVQTYPPVRYPPSIWGGANSCLLACFHRTLVFEHRSKMRFELHVRRRAKHELCGDYMGGHSIPELARGKQWLLRIGRTRHATAAASPAAATKTKQGRMLTSNSLEHLGPVA